MAVVRLMTGGVSWSHLHRETPITDMQKNLVEEPTGSRVLVIDGY